MVFTADPSMVHENVGGGLPFASHVNATLNPSITIRFCGGWENSGWSVLRNQIDILISTGCIMGGFGKTNMNIPPKMTVLPGWP